MSIKDIAQQLEVSRSPVRDSIIKLGKEGLVDIISQSGTYVSKIDLKRVGEEQFIRNGLEEKAVLLFMKEFKSNDINQLETIIKLQEETLGNRDYTSFLDYDDQFHSVFFHGADKSLSWELIVSMSGHYRRLRLMTLWDLEISEDVIRQHRELLQNIKNNDSEKVRQTLEDHILRIFSQKDYMTEKYPTYFKQNENDEKNFLVRNFMR